MTRIYRFIFLALIFVQTRPAFAQQKVPFVPTQRLAVIQQHQVVDLVFTTSKSPVGNPFDATFGAIFTDSNEVRQTVPGFYNGKHEYVIRFSSAQQGTFTFQTFSTSSDLAGLQGSLDIIENTNPNQHGAVVIQPETPQKFTYQDGQSYFALAFELDWLFALDANNQDGLPKTTEIVQSVKANGFNQIVMNVYAYDVGWPIAEDVPERYQFGQPPYSVFAGSNEQPEFSQLNLSFFQHFDRVIQYLNEQGMVAHLMIYVWNKKVTWPAMYSAADNRYFDYVIKRYQAYPNIIWDVSKEALDYGRCDIPYINERIQRIRRLDAFQRLITVHDYEYCSRQADKVDFISIQNWRSDLYSLSLEALQKHPDKPVMNIEHGGYEAGPYPSFTGNYTSPEVCLERNYHCVFAGLYSSYYWQNTSWNIVIYDAMHPRQTLPRPKLEYYKQLQQLFTRYDFNELKPYRPKLTTNSRPGNDNLATSGYPLTNDKGLYLYFVPAANYLVNVVVPKPATNTLEASWFNIFTGETLQEPTTDWQLFKGYQSPWPGQAAVLILKSS